MIEEYYCHLLINECDKTSIRCSFKYRSQFETESRFELENHPVGKALFLMKNRNNFDSRCWKEREPDTALAIGCKWMMATLPARMLRQVLLDDDDEARCCLELRCQISRDKAASHDMLCCIPRLWCMRIHLGYYTAKVHSDWSSNVFAILLKYCHPSFTKAESVNRQLKSE